MTTTGQGSHIHWLAAHTNNYFMPADGLGSVSVRRGTYTAASWTATSMVLSAATADPRPGDLVLVTDSGHWGVLTSGAEAGATDTFTVKRWNPPDKVTGLPSTPTTTGASAIWIFPATHISPSRRTRIEGLSIKAGGLGAADFYIYEYGSTPVARAYIQCPVSTTEDWDINTDVLGIWYIHSADGNLSDGGMSYEVFGEREI